SSTPGFQVSLSEKGARSVRAPFSFPLRRVTARLPVESHSNGYARLRLPLRRRQYPSRQRSCYSRSQAPPGKAGRPGTRALLLGDLRTAAIGAWLCRLSRRPPALSPAIPARSGIAHGLALPGELSLRHPSLSRFS